MRVENDKRYAGKAPDSDDHISPCPDFSSAAIR